MTFATSKRMDGLYAALAVLLILSLFVANRYLGNVSALWRFLGFLVAASLVLVLLLKTRWGRSVFMQCQDVRQEVARMHWPTREETIQTTVATLAMVLLMGVLLWAADFILLRAVKWLTGHWGV